MSLSKIFVIALMSFVLTALPVVGVQSQANVPLTTDTRIKTFVYNESEVFHITIHYGYVTNIQFSSKEKILLTYPGNAYAWDIKQRGDSLLFIKALEGSSHTNMTVVTNKRTYYFDLESKNPDENLDEELVYSVKFFYPSENLDKPQPKINTSQFKPVPLKENKRYNFDYSLTGPEKIAPVKVFDDGFSTFLQFANNNATIPHIFIIGANGEEKRVSYSRKGQFIIINGVVNKLALRLGEDVVFVYNELGANNG